MILTGLTEAWARQRGRLFLWLPVALGAGAASYLYLPAEPSWAVFAIPSMLIAATLVFVRRLNWPSYVDGLLLLLLVFAVGLNLTKIRTEIVRAPVVNPERNQYMLTAYVVDNISASADQPRLLVAPVSMDGVGATDLPQRLRLTVKAGAMAGNELTPGDLISAFALVDPPPAPSVPGGYDFARMAYFQRVGGVGFVPGKIEKLQGLRPEVGLAIAMATNRLRWRLTRALVDQISPGFPNDPALGGFAAALVTGHQALVPQALIGKMRDSGLAHILSISGVHMGVVGGFVFYALRFLMATLPALALRIPIKKVAAGLSIVATLVYLALSGAPAPAVRAAIVAVVAFAAIIVDRRALSLRGLAIAALIIIGFTPEAVVQPGFQMSFAATAALLAVFEIWPTQIRELSVPWWVKAVQSAIDGMRMSLAVSVVCTLATLPLAAAYFNRISIYGLVSNLFEAPITAVVMPCLAVGTVLAGTPVGWLVLRMSAAGLWLIERIAAITAGLPFAVFTLASAPGYVLSLSFAGVLWVCLVRGRARWLGVVAGLAILWWPRLSPPDIWIDPQGGNAAIRATDGAYALRRARRYGFEQWTQRYGLAALDDRARDRDYVCRGYGCIPKPSNPVKVGFWFSNAPPTDKRLAEICAASQLVVMRSQMVAWPASCSGINHISAGDFRRLGAMELTRTQKGWAIHAAQPLRGRRYWSSPSGADDQ